MLPARVQQSSLGGDRAKLEDRPPAQRPSVIYDPAQSRSTMQTAVQLMFVLYNVSDVYMSCSLVEFTRLASDGTLDDMMI